MLLTGEIELGYRMILENDNKVPNIPELYVWPSVPYW